MQPIRPEIAAVAQALVRARREGRACDATPFAAALADADEAYRVQALVAQALPAPGRTMPACWKSGGPARTAVLTHAPLPRAGVWRSPADASAWPFNLRLVEAEVALRLGRDVDPSQALALVSDDAPSLVDAMAVSIEIVDSRWQQGTEAPALLKLADLQSHGALVLGEWMPFAPRDWSRQRCEVRIGRRPADQRVGTHALGDPAWLLPAWLRHATRDGATVPAGTVVTTGTWCGMLQAQPGERVSVRFEAIGEAQVQL